jgi:hypothetical protein
LIVGATVPVLAFLDTTDLGTGSFDFDGNGMIFIIMASLYGFSVIMNFMQFGAEKKWHKAMVIYNGFK